jgi:hypothetical protein
MALEKHKLGNWRMLAEPIDLALTVELNKAAPNFEENFYRHIIDVRRLIEVVDQRLSLYIEHIKQQAQLNKIELNVIQVSCHRQSCMTCLGKFPTHYPHFRTKTSTKTLFSKEGLMAYIKKSNWKAVKRRELKDFLRRIGIEEERIKRFLQLIDLRDVLIQYYHFGILTFKWSGVSSIELEVPTE